MSEDRLYLVDGSSFIHRAYHAVRPLSTRAGVPTNAVFGFTSLLVKLLDEQRPSHVAVAFDGPPPTFRHALYAEYKANRPPAPGDLVPQFGLCRDVVRALDVASLELAGVEADDLIATFTRLAREAGLPVTIVSGDKDLMQLVGEGVVAWDTMRDVIYDPAAVEAKFGVPPGQLGALLALTGDASDNVPGVEGIGPKTAAELLRAHGSLEGVLAAAPGLKGKKGQTLVAQADRARLSADLVRLEDHVDLPVTLETLRRRPVDVAAAAALFERLEFQRMLGQLQRIAAAAPPPPSPSPSPSPTVSTQGDLFAAGPAPAPPPALPLAPPAAPPPAVGVAGGPDPSRYETIRDLDRLDAFLAAADTAGELAVDLETTCLSVASAEIVGVSLCHGPGHAAYVPVSHRGLDVGPQPRRDAVLDRLRPRLEGERPLLHMQNHKYETGVFRRHGIRLRGVGCDPMIASYLLDPSHESHSLEALAHRELGYRVLTYKEVCGTGKNARSFDELDVPLATRYSAEDAEVTFLLAARLTPRVHAAALDRLMWDVEVPLARVLAILELTGVTLDAGRLHALSREMEGRLVDLEADVAQRTGLAVNLNSPKQLQALLFDHLGLKPGKKTSTGYSTDAEVLEELATEHPVAALINEYRQLQKLKGTYVDALPRLVNRHTGRLHTSYNQAVAATGRLSSSDPNLQNIPIRTDLGRQIRAAFVAPPGRRLISADYSQIELRVLAHLSGDAALLEAFAAGADVHARTAAEIFGVAPDAVDREQRRVAKAVNFGVIYGQGGFGLARQLKIGRSVAAGYIERYFERYPGIRHYMDAVIASAGETGVATTILGRRRPLPDLQSRNPNVRAGAERMARNTPIQGSAADLIKLAMLRCQDRLERDFPDARMLLTVHDELVIEAAEAEAEAVGAAMKEEMEKVHPLSVPLVVDVGIGADWLAAH